MLTAAALAAFAAAVHSAESSSPANRRGWQELSLVNASVARETFAAVTPADRETRLGAALALLQLRARTPANVANATGLLDALRSENPGDDVGIGATYYLARIAQVHSFTPDRDAAIVGYRTLLAQHPGHHYAQLAAPKLAVLLLYDEVAPVEWERRVTEVAGLIPRLTAPEAIRDTRLTLAMAFIRMRNDIARAYPLFASCLADGTVTRLPRQNAVLVMAAESARQLGKPAQAADYYTKFLEAFPQDVKADEIRRRLIEVTREAGR